MAILFILNFFSFSVARETESLNKKLIDECLIKAQEGKPARRYQSRPQTDLVFKKDNQINIQIQLQLRYEYNFSSQEFNKAKELIEGAKKVIIDFYQKHNLVLDIEIEHAPYDFNSFSGHSMPIKERAHVIYIKKQTGDAMWSVLWGVNFDWDPQSRGMIYTHELSHLFGLPDEYLGPRSPREGEPDNIMRDWAHPEARFYPHQIKHLISPLCPE